MSRSFYTGDYTELLNGSVGFSEQISATPTAFGLTAPQAAAYAALHDAYVAAYQAAENPLTRTMGKIAARNDAAVLLREMAANLGRIITGNPSVTTEQRIGLGLSVRDTPSPVGPPGTAEAFTATLDAGALNLKWKCKNPVGSTGTVYMVWRQIDGGPSEFVGGSGTKSFVDATVPAGSAVVTYKIQAVRSTTVGAWATFVVAFGMSSSGQATLTVTEPKLAA